MVEILSDTQRKVLKAASNICPGCDNSIPAGNLTGERVCIKGGQQQMVEVADGDKCLVAVKSGVSGVIMFGGVFTPHE